MELAGVWVEDAQLGRRQIFGDHGTVRSVIAFRHQAFWPLEIVKFCTIRGSKALILVDKSSHSFYLYCCTVWLRKGLLTVTDCSLFTLYFFGEWILRHGLKSSQNAVNLKKPQIVLLQNEELKVKPLVHATAVRSITVRVIFFGGGVKWEMVQRPGYPWQYWNGVGSSLKFKVKVKEAFGIVSLWFGLWRNNWRFEKWGFWCICTKVKWIHLS